MLLRLEQNYEIIIAIPTKWCTGVLILWNTPVHGGQYRAENGTETFLGFLFVIFEHFDDSVMSGWCAI